MPSQDAAGLQHLRQVAQQQQAVIERQTPIDKGDLYVLRRSRNPDLNLTKSDVKVRTNNRNESPFKSMRDSHLVWSFTPDIGIRGSPRCPFPSSHTATSIPNAGDAFVMRSRRKHGRRRPPRSRNGIHRGHLPALRQGEPHRGLCGGFAFRWHHRVGICRQEPIRASPLTRLPARPLSR